jgi:putative phage-type endonuclease
MSDQRSPEWYAARAGKITASRFADAIAMDKRNPDRSTETRDRYMRELAAEILSGQPRHEVGGKALAWGTEAESFARQAYEFAQGAFVEESPFVLHPTFDFIGASPDGLVGDDGGLEMKCPMDESVHIKTLLRGMPDEHKAQVQGNMLVTGRQWWDFVSFDPRQAESFRLYVERIQRDDCYINHVLLPGLLQFWAKVQDMVAKIKRKAA